MVARQALTVLVVDDDDADTMMIEEALSAAATPPVVHRVSDGTEALDYLRRTGAYPEAQRPDLILLDLNMPRMDGREVLLAIKADPKLRGIPIVVLTSSAAQQDVLRSYDLGANSFITKPVTFDGLVAAMKTLGMYWHGLVALPSNE